VKRVEFKILPGDNQRGIALLTVLWVITVLMVIVFSFSFMARTETLSTLSFKEGIENKFLAEAGVERGILELYFRKENLTKVLIEDQAVWKVDGSLYSGQVGDGHYAVRIIDESGKLDINFAPELLLRNLLGNLGLEGTALDTIVDSILDWKDKDDLHRLNGAESDYYLSLPNPYKAKNGNFESLEELLLVKGVTREILYGSGRQKGLIDLLTVHGRTGKVNINAASKEILLSIPGITSDMVEEILIFREKQEIKTIQEIGGSVVINQALLIPYITFGQGNTFTIESSGYREKPQSGYAIRTTVTLLSDNQYKFLYYKTPVTLKQDETATKLP
jgi:general secretion pathway protein K